MKLVLVKCLAPLVFYQQITYDDDTGEDKPGRKIAQQPKEEDAEGEDESCLKVEQNAGRKWAISFSQYGGFYTDDDEEKDYETRKSHRATDWQNVALIWDKFMMIMMGIMTAIALAIVFFLYVAEIRRNDIDFEADDGMEVESEGLN